MTEAAIQKAVVEYLRAVLPTDAIVAHVPNQVERNGKAAMREVQSKKAMGMLPGFPDILLFVNGRGCTMEVKTQAGRLSPVQCLVRDNLQRQGIPYGVVRSVDDARKLLAVWGVETMEVANA